jgi:hypothetical protein
MEYATKDTLRLAFKHHVEAVAQSTTAIHVMEFTADELIRLVLCVTPHVVPLCVHSGCIEEVIIGVARDMGRWEVFAPRERTPLRLQLLHDLLQQADVSTFHRYDDRPDISRVFMAVGDAQLLQRPWAGGSSFMEAYPRCVLAPNVLDMFPVVTAWPFGDSVPPDNVVARLFELYNIRIPYDLFLRKACLFDLLQYAEDGPVQWPGVPECWYARKVLSHSITQDFVEEMTRRGSPLPWDHFWSNPKPWMVPFMGTLPDNMYALCMDRTTGKYVRKRMVRALQLAKAVAVRRCDHAMVGCINKLMGE